MQIDDLKKALLTNYFRARRVLRRQVHRSALFQDSVVSQFHKLYYDAHSRGLTWHGTYWMGVQILKCPLDMWLYQEIIHAHRPDVIVETGTCFGGSALYMAQLCEIVGNGRVVTVDIAPKPGRPVHPRITYLTGSSTAPEMLVKVREQLEGAGKVMVVLDSDHSKRHVLEELRLYAPLVTPGCHLIVEDGNVNGHPVAPEHGPGPTEAMAEFVPRNPQFVRDHRQDKFFLTFNPGGYLLRTK